MDYIGNKCPVCDKYFHANDEIVVCPECGTPHHRECYEAEGHCHNLSRHQEGYDYSEDKTQSAAPHAVICPSCGKENDEGSFFCKYCATPLSSQDAQPQQPQQPPRSPFAAFNPDGSSDSPFPFMDPMGGVPADTDFGDGVTAGETAKYVKQSTPYYMRVFNNIRTVNRSKFNFTAAIFAGGFLLYRKMYKLGALITALQLTMMILKLYVEITYSTLFAQLTEAVRGATSSLTFFQYFATLSTTEQLTLFLPDLIDMVNLVIMLVIGFTFNRLYFKHCREQINKIKSVTPDGENAETVLQTKGGVNIPLAISLIVSYLVIQLLPNILSGLL